MYGQHDLQSLLKNEQYDLIISQCKDKPQDSLCSIPLARSYYITGDLASAKTVYESILLGQDNHIEAHKRIGSIYEQQQHWAKAMKHYTAVNNIDTTDAIYYRKNAHIHKVIGDIKNAQYLYQKAVELNPRDLMSAEGLAKVYMAQDSLALADQLITQALLADSMHIGLQLLHAKVKYKMKEFDRCVDIFSSIQNHYDFRYVEHKLMGFAYYRLDSLDKAIHNLTTAASDDPNPEKTYYYLSQCYYKKDSLELALDFMVKTIDHARSPDYHHYLSIAGHTSEQMKDLKKALDYNMKIYHDGIKSSPLLYKIATLSDRYYKDKSIAIRWYGQYLKLDDDHLERREYAEQRRTYLQKEEHMRKR